MVSQMIDSIREKAEIYVEETECEKRAILLLDEFNIPRGLLPLENIVVEIGLVRSEGFIWRRQKKKKDHYFEQIGRSVSFAAEVTAYIEPRRMKKVNWCEGQGAPSLDWGLRYVGGAVKFREHPV